MGKTSIIKEIRRHLYTLSRKKDFREGGREQKTIYVKTALCRAVKTALGNAQDLRVCATYDKHRHEDDGEWLYDVACLKYSGRDDKGGWKWPVKRVPMVAECEWGRNQAIRNDFDKLVVARADVRVMVYDRNGFPLYEDDFEELKKLIGMYPAHRTRDTYFLASWRKDHFKCKTITVRSNTGR